ncbi:MAG: HNH endonuclease [Gammaproteobacteria bacterium CG11_big_fil_rev_8_21_14_0_20_46_22]|nr:MAG: HNH endonuclease [Gammaproteobacteria bacterium CG12_big_fil_rev_8_21_14_0_65_46_12]PIR10541.1 MAG: HNH endonuclease [Gammaproteobacteria bacterium CG11_big_fil_rev_8_21_14_0_20_46_22]
MLELHPTLSPQSWRIFSVRRLDLRFFPARDKVLHRDHHACGYCGFQASEHQEIVNIDGDYQNNRLSNLVTACVFCAQSLFLDNVGVSFGGGKLIYLPGMSQAELNSFCHVIFCAMMNRTGYLNSAQTAYRNLRLQAQHVEKKFGTGMSAPGQFCRLALNQKNVGKEQMAQLLRDIRLLPSYAKFKQQLSDWAAAAAQELAEEA